MSTTPFTREPRYMVVKVKDADAALSPTEQGILRMIGNKVERWRKSHGKTNLSGVFVEHDWPEHEPVWKMIEQRTTGAAATPDPLVLPGLICEHDWIIYAGNGKPYHTCMYCKKSEPMEQPT